MLELTSSTRQMFEVLSSELLTVVRHTWAVSHLLQLLGFDVHLLLQGAVGLLQLQSLFISTLHLLLDLSLPPGLTGTDERPDTRTVGQKQHHC